MSAEGRNSKRRTSGAVGVKPKISRHCVQTNANGSTWTEEERLQSLYQLKVLDTAPEERFDRITRLVAAAFDVPMALVSLVDRHRQWFKSTCGVPSRETPLEHAFCTHALREPEIMVVPDAEQDPRFCDNPLVTGYPHIRFYAGAVIQAAGRLPLGTLCVVDVRPREITEQQRELLIALARLVESELMPPLADMQGRARMQLAANIDPVTGFFTLHEFRARTVALIDDAHCQASAAEPRRGCLLLIEISQLDLVRRQKNLVDADELLALVATHLHAALEQDNAIYGRHGNNGLAAYVPEVNEPQVIADKLREALSNVCLAGEAAPLCIQLGLSALTSNFDDAWHQCLLAVDALRGRSGFASKYFSDRDRARLDRASRMALALPGAMAGGELVLMYQPKISTHSRQLVGLEALLRWPRIDAVMPPEIFEAAATIDAVFALDAWVIRTACTQIKAWRDQGLQVVPVAINICGQTLHHPELVDLILREIEASHIDPALLELEILENCVISEFESILLQLSRLKEHGISFALDDFGTGYSSLSYLQQLPVDTVKMDKSFISGIVDKPADAKLAAGIVALAHDLGKMVVAEGVETRLQYKMLRDLDCDIIQGYLFSRPLSPADTAPLFETNKSFRYCH